MTGVLTFVRSVTRTIALAAPVACASAAYNPMPERPTQSWPVVTRIHVDLWLHGYAMLLRDTATVPVFRRNYRDSVRAVRAQRVVTTRLDSDRERLQARFAMSGSIVNGQFLPLYFASWDQMQNVIDLFLRASGDVRAAGDQAMAQYFAVLGQSFPSGADREWLRLLTAALEDERRQFFQTWWVQEHAARLAHVRAVDSLWQGGMRQRFQRFLSNTRQETGDFVLARTIGPEGRTVNFSARQNAITVAMPDSTPFEAFYVFAHEAVGALVGPAVTDHTTPAEQRAGVAGRHVTMGQVQGGAMLLRRVAPELVDGYLRYYLRQAGQPTTGDLEARMASVFPLPDPIRQALNRQIEVVLGGI